MKRIYFMIFLVFAVILNSCATLRPNESWENLLNRAKKPVYVISVYNNKDMVYVLFKDANGKLFTINGLQFYSLEAGYIFY